MTGEEVRRCAIAELKECIRLIEERGKEYGNASISEPGMLTNRSPEDSNLAMIEAKLTRFKEGIRLHGRPKKDTVRDLINYQAFYSAIISDEPGTT